MKIYPNFTVTKLTLFIVFTIFVSTVFFFISFSDQDQISLLIIEKQDGTKRSIAVNCDNLCPFIREYPELKITDSWRNSLMLGLNSILSKPMEALPPNKDLNEFGLDSPFGKLIGVYPNGAKKFSLVLGSYNNFYDARYAFNKNDKSFLMLERETEELFYSLNNLIFDNPISQGITLSKVGKLVISGVKVSELNMVLNGKSWSVNNRPADRAFVEGFIRDFVELDFVEILPAEDAALKNEVISIIVSYHNPSVDSDNHELFTVFKGKHASQDTGWYLRRASLPYLFKLKSGRMFERLPREEHFSEILDKDISTESAD
jgi:hypothetical protein